MARNWVDALTQFTRTATLQLGNPRRPWRYFTREVKDLDHRTGTPARVRGIFNITLEFDPLLKECGTTMSAFVMEHELQHMTGKHGFWLLVTLLLCLPLALVVKQWQEARADRAAARLMPPSHFLSCAEVLDSPRWRHRIIHGDPVSRTKRAYGLDDEGMSRWLFARSMVAATH